MPCCIIAAALIAKFLFKWKSLKAYLGFAVNDDNPYGWDEYCELDQFES